MNASTARARMEWVDVAKGLGILIVVIAHVWTRGDVRDAIYAFHMPLFFLLSGYTSAPRPMGVFAPRLLRAMAVPYASFLLTLALWDAGFETWRGHHPVFRDVPDALWRLAVGGSELRGPFTIFWFVPALFFGRLIQNALGQYWPDALDPRWLALVGLCLLLGVWLGARSDFSPLGLLSVPLVVAYLWCGARWRAMADDRMMLLGALVVGLVLIWALRHYHVPPLNMKVGDYGWAWVSLPAALILSLGLCAVARHVPVWPLAALGRMSLVIMYLHVAVIHYAAPYLAKGWLLVLALAMSVLASRVLEKFSVTRALYLGQS